MSDTTTLKDVKQRFIDYLMAMDLDKLDMSGLSTYSYILKTLDEMEKPGYAEAMAMAMSSFNSAKKIEEAEKNG